MSTPVWMGMELRLPEAGGPKRVRDGSTGGASIIPEGNDTLTRSVGKNLDIVQDATLASEALEACRLALLTLQYG